MILEECVADISEMQCPEKLSTLTVLKTNITSAEDAALFAQDVGNIPFNLKWFKLD